jgi:single-strand DNA-binding protein
MSLNRAMVIGNLGGDPELRHLPTGQPVVGFSIATDESFTDKQGRKQDRVEWHHKHSESSPKPATHTSRRDGRFS